MTLSPRILFVAPAFVAILTVFTGLAALPQTNPSKAEPFSKNGAQKEALDAGSGPLFFVRAVDYGSGGYGAADVAVADLNGDGKPDAIVSNSCGDGTCANRRGSVGVLMGNGDGTFGIVVTYDAGGDDAGTVAVGDLNLDGKPDLVVISSSLGVLLGKGDGTFQPVVAYSTNGRRPIKVALADVNGDGKLDLLIANRDGTVSARLGKGDGTFQPDVLYPSNEIAYSIAVADVNGDGKLDLVLGSTCTVQPFACTDLAGVLLGNGDGTFRPVVSYNSGDRYQSFVAVADVNGDGKPDLLAVGYGSGTVGVLLGNNDGTFQPVLIYPTNADLTIAIAVRDVNSDGKPDLLVATETGVSLLLGNGNGTFQPAVDYHSDGQFHNSFTIADVNGDAFPDVLVADFDGVGTVGVLLNNTGAPPTATSLVASVNPVLLRRVVTYTATVTPQAGGDLSGTVMFKDGNSPIAVVTLAGNQAAFDASYKKVGPHLITADYSGDLHHARGSFDTLIEYSRGPSQTVLTTSGSPSLVGQTVTFMAKVTSKYGAIPNGELVTFYDGATVLASGELSGGTALYTTSSLSAKTHNIKASYSGDPMFASSTGSVTQLVEGYSTTTALISSLNPSQFGQAVTFTAQVTSTGPAPTGKMKFLDGTTVIGSAMLSGGVAKLRKSTLAVGTHPITARYVGDAASAASTSSVLNQVVQ